MRAHHRPGEGRGGERLRWRQRRLDEGRHEYHGRLQQRGREHLDLREGRIRICDHQKEHLRRLPHGRRGTHGLRGHPQHQLRRRAVRLRRQRHRRHGVRQHARRCQRRHRTQHLGRFERLLPVQDHRPARGRKRLRFRRPRLYRYPCRPSHHRRTLRGQRHGEPLRWQYHD